MVTRKRTRRGNRDLMVKRTHFFPPAQLEALQRESDRLGVPESEIIRQAIGMWLKARARETASASGTAP